MTVPRKSAAHPDDATLYPFSLYALSYKICTGLAKYHVSGLLDDFHVSRLVL